MNELKPIKYAHIAQLSSAVHANATIIQAFDQYCDLPEVKKTHFFEGRYENIYIEREKIPALGAVLDEATAYAASLLALQPEALACGFWFNSMESGHVTLPHTHDDDDELLSAVYYLEVPENSGNLLLGVASQQSELAPEAGMLVLFSPQLVHAVAVNNSPSRRLSIGLNFGLKENSKSV